jgi:Cu/Ag efflux protein CusF
MKFSPLRYRYLILPVIIAFLSGVVISQTDSGMGNDNGGKKIWEKKTITAEITKINKDNNEVTLKGPKGREISFIVDKNVNLSNLKEGDSVKAEYYRSVAMQVGKPTPEQEKQPFTVLEAKKIAPAGVDLAGGSLRQVKAVVNVKKVDRAAQQIVIEGPNGNEFTISVADKRIFDKIKEGENAVITYTEALATTLEKTK